MKFSIRSFLLLAAGCVFFVGFGSREAMAAPIPPSALAGTYTVTGRGSVAICTGPAPTFTEIPCSKFKEGVDFSFPMTVVQVGEITIDAKGNSCDTITETVSDFPVDFSPPIVPTAHDVVLAKNVSYDPSTGIGDVSGTAFTGGSCNGAVFNSKGATKVNTFSDHFIASDNGNRIDTLLTKLQDPIGGIGDFSFSAIDLKRP
ncbi:MAG: hypothetical protein JO071_16665 [Deltaproteobacteria bacterium]|nr:hypothetical protein [Deltaproteobacteria bacterium]